MSNGWKRLLAAPLSAVARLLGATAGFAVRKPATPGQDLLDAALEALNIARDSKALVVAKDGAIININSLASQLCGRSRDQLIGKSVAAELFEHAPAQLSGTAIQRWETTLKTASRGPIAVEVVRQPLGTRLQGVQVYAIRDLRERYEAAEERERQNRVLQQRDEELRTQNLRFQTALNNMSQGLCMVDAAERLLVCNDRYARMYALSSEQVRSGTLVREILAHRVANGFYVGPDPEAYVRDLLAFAKSNRAGTTIQALNDGRIISIVSQPMPGGGWVATHEDITEREKLSAQLEQQNALLKEQDEQLRAQNLQFDAALNSMAQGLCMFDEEHRVILCNARLLDLCGFDANVIKPGVTALQMAQHSASLGNHGEATGEQVYAEFANLFGDREARLVSPLASGRIIAMHSRPMGNGGWVITCDDMTERERTTQEIREQNLRFDVALNNMSQGFCMFDAEQRLVVCNEKYTGLFGADPSYGKSGTTLRAIFEQGLARGLFHGNIEDLLARRLAAVAEQRQVNYDQLLADGRTIAISICPMPNGSWVGLFEDKTEQRRAEAERAAAVAELQTQYLRFDAALNNMAQGLAMFDDEQRLVVCNDLYAEMYGLTREQVKPGTTLRQIFEYRVADGLYDGRTVENILEAIPELMARRQVSHIPVKLGDGRTVVISMQPRPDGGWVTTHQDVTERERLNAELAEQRERLDTALRKMSQGLCMYDANQRVVVANERFAALYGLTPEQVKPGTTLREIVERRIANGLFAGATPQEYMRERLRAFEEASTSTQQLSDGRFIRMALFRNDVASYAAAAMR